MVILTILTYLSEGVVDLIPYEDKLMMMMMMMRRRRRMTTTTMTMTMTMMIIVSVHERPVWIEHV